MVSAPLELLPGRRQQAPAGADADLAAVGDGGGRGADIGGSWLVHRQSPFGVWWKEHAGGHGPPVDGGIFTHSRNSCQGIFPTKGVTGTARVARPRKREK